MYKILIILSGMIFIISNASAALSSDEQPVGSFWHKAKNKPNTNVMVQKK